jgi:hypothetical protein
MTFPALLFGLLVASLYGAFYHLVRGDGPRRLVYYLLLAWAGFALGHLVGGWFGWSFLRFGSLNGGVATVGCFIFLAAGDWLGRIERTA